MTQHVTIHMTLKQAVAANTALKAMIDRALTEDRQYPLGMKWERDAIAMLRMRMNEAIAVGRMKLAEREDWQSSREMAADRAESVEGNDELR